MRWFFRRRARSQPFRLAWLTDIHLNFLGPSGLQNFLDMTSEIEVHAYAISGDIGEAHSVSEYLKSFARAVQRPVYFVLGNHDFYRSSIAQVRQDIAALQPPDLKLHYLTVCEPLELTPEAAIVGHDAWSDGRYGDFLKSSLMLNDYVLIQELSEAYSRGGHVSLFERLQALGDEAAQSLTTRLSQALERYKLVFVVIHPPPFVENSLYKGLPSPLNALPHFSCKAVGDVLLTMADRYPHRRMIVVCGHTHTASETYLRPNLQVISGAAEYRSPKVQRIFLVE